MLLQGFKTLNVQIWVNGLNTHGITSTKITPSAFQKISGHDFPCWRGSFNLVLPRRRWM